MYEFVKLFTSSGSSDHSDWSVEKAKKNLTFC